MKVITWNVNGIRTKIFNKLSSAKISKEHQIFPDVISPISNILKLDADFICLQETWCSELNGKKFNINGYNSVFNESKHEQQARNANRYSGTCIFYKETFKPICIEYQIPGYNDDEGRIIILHFGLASANLKVSSKVVQATTSAFGKTSRQAKCEYAPFSPWNATLILSLIMCSCLL